MEMIENQVYLAQGEYSKVIGRSESILAMCQGSSLRSGSASCADPASCGQLEAGKNRTGA